jgi:hypothetical protein
MILDSLSSEKLKESKFGLNFYKMHVYNQQFYVKNDKNWIDSATVVYEEVFALRFLSDFEKN